jgi:Mg2+ and Co2+ transporter CorA
LRIFAHGAVPHFSLVFDSPPRIFVKFRANRSRRIVSESRKRLLLISVASVLNDRVIGVLAILAVASSIYADLFDIPEEQALVLAWVEWTAVFAFAADYLVHLALAGDKKAYVLSGWRILDLCIIVACTLTLLPAFDTSLRRILGLRLLGIIRALGFGLRVKSSLGRVLPAYAAQASSLPRTFSVHWEDSWKALPIGWADFVTRSATKGNGWLDAYDVGAKQLEELAHSLKMPPALFSILRSASAYPRLKVIGARLVATLWLPLVKQSEWLEIDRVSVLLSLGEHGPLVTIAPIDCQLQQRMARWLSPEADPSVEAMAAEAYFRMVLEQNEEALAHLEEGLRQMEEVPLASVGEEFSRFAFRLRRDLSQIKADLWRLGGILDAVKTKRLPLPRCADEDDDAFLVLSDQADYLYETASNLREQLISLIELHMNTVSFRMNRFMQLLAVVTVLAAIPATVGGLLGMNVLGNPWPVSLGQVTFGVAVGVLTALYLFLSSRHAG